MNTVMNNLCRITRKVVQCRQLYQSRQFLQDNFYEPSYLESMKPRLPIYDELNVQLHGYDFPVLESYQKFVHNMLKNMEVEVEECWATPHQEMQITTLKPKSDVVNAQYNLKIYQRTIQIIDVTSTQLPVILRALEASTPVGVTVCIIPHEKWHEDVRYVPDTELKVLKQELEDMGGPVKKK